MLRRRRSPPGPDRARAGLRVDVLYFAILRERLRRDGDTLELPEGSDVSAARAAIARRHPEVAALLPRIATAVNRAIVVEGHALADGDELALIPPVSGG